MGSTSVWLVGCQRTALVYYAPMLLYICWEWKGKPRDPELVLSPYGDCMSCLGGKSEQY